MGWTISTIILIVISTILGFALYNLLKKNENLEDFITKQSDAINACGQRLKNIDMMPNTHRFRGKVYSI